MPVAGAALRSVRTWGFVKGRGPSQEGVKQVDSWEKSTGQGCGLQGPAAGAMGVVEVVFAESYTCSGSCRLQLLHHT